MSLSNKAKAIQKDSKGNKLGRKDQHPPLSLKDKMPVGNQPLITESLKNGSVEKTFEDEVESGRAVQSQQDKVSVNSSNHKEATCEFASVGANVNTFESLSPANSPAQTPLKGNVLQKNAQSIQHKISEVKKSYEQLKNMAESLTCANQLNRDDASSQSSYHDQEEVSDHDEDRGLTSDENGTESDGSVGVEEESNYQDRSEQLQYAAQTRARRMLNRNAEIPHQEEVPSSQSPDSMLRLPSQDCDRIMGSSNQEEESVIAHYKQRLQEGDNTVVFEMFEMMLAKMNQMQNKLTSIELEQAHLERQMQKQTAFRKAQLAINQKTDDEQLLLAEATMNAIEAVIKLEVDVAGVGTRVEKLDIRMSKGSWTVTGIPERKNENAKNKVYDFMKEHLGIPGEELPEIQTAYRIGKLDKNAKKKKDRSLFFKLYDPNENHIIFANIDNLRNRKNSKKKPIYMNEQLTELEKEKKRRRREIKKDNQKLPMSHQMKIDTEAGEMLLNGNPYRKQVPPPKMKEVLTATNADKLQYRNLASDIIPGNEMEVEDTKYYSYALQCTSFEEIQIAYHSIKEKHLSATHIICGYRLFGTKVPLLQDFSDDGDHACGRHILNALKRVGVFNIAVFIVRYYGEQNIGTRRFQAMSELTDAVLQLCPNLEYGQNLRDADTLKILNRIARVKRAATDTTPQSSAPASDNEGGSQCSERTKRANRRQRKNDRRN